MAIFVVWFTRTRGYLQDGDRHIKDINNADIFGSEYAAKRAAEKISYPTSDGQIQEPFVIDECGLRRLSGDDD